MWIILLKILRSQKIPVEILFILIAVIYGVWLVVFWPGALGEDSIAIIKEVLDPDRFLSGKTNFWYWFVRLFYLDHERVEVPIGIMLILSAIIQARILGWCWIQKLKKTTAFLLIFITLAPHFILYIGTLYPDGIYSVAVVGLLFESWLIACTKRCGFASFVMVAVTFPFAAFARPNGIVFIVPVVFLSVWIWKHYRRDGTLLGIIVAAWCAANIIGYRQHPSQTQKAAYPLAIFETVNFLQPRPMNLWTATPRISPQTITTLKKYNPIDVYFKNYDPDYWDALVYLEGGPHVQSFSEADRKIITREFFRYNLWHNIPKFWGSRINVFLTACLAQGGAPPDPTYAKHVIDIVKSKSTYRLFGLNRTETLMSRIYEFSYMYRWLFWTPFLGLGLMCWALVIGIGSRDWPMLLVATSMLVQFGGILFFSIAGEYRYILPFFTLPLALLPMIVIHRRHSAEKTALTTSPVVPC